MFTETVREGRAQGGTLEDSDHNDTRDLLRHLFTTRGRTNQIPTVVAEEPILLPSF